MHDASPGLDVGAVFVVVSGYPAHGDVFEDFELVLELADAAEGDAGGAVEGAVFDEDVGAVCDCFFLFSLGAGGQGEFFWFYLLALKAMLSSPLSITNLANVMSEA